MIGVVNASDSDNETLHITKESTCQINTTEHVLSESIDSEIISATNESITGAIKKPVISSTSKAKVNLKASNVKMHYGDGSHFKITLKDNKKKVMKNTKVTITLNKKTYTKTTDSKGTASLKLDLNSGTYKVTTTYEGSSKFQKKSITNTITVKSTIKASDFSKYYKNTKTYSATFYNTNGKALKKTTVKYYIGNTVKSAKTDSKGVVKISINLNPQKCLIQLGNTATGEVVSKVITIKPTLEQRSFTMDSKGNAKYIVKVLDSNGKAKYNQKVTFKVNGKSYSQKSNKNGFATLSVTLNLGKHTFQAEYDGLKVNYEVNVNSNSIPDAAEPVKNTTFSHVISIPTYINVTMPYVFYDTEYVLKSGFDGIIKVPKNDLFVVDTPYSSYSFTTATNGLANSLSYYKYLIPFDGTSLQKSFKKESLTGDGILIYKNGNNVEIEFRNRNENNTDLFSTYLSKGFDVSETVTYIQNSNIKAKVTFFTEGYDEVGLRYNIAKYYGKTIYDFNNQNYTQITNNQVKFIKYANTNETIKLSYFGNYLAGLPSQEKIITKFYVNGKEELEKSEFISYGQSEDYRQNAGFEVLQSYAIINEKITDNLFIKWLAKNSTYIQKTGIANAYSMFLTALETGWLADKIADENAKDMKVNWKRDSTVTILGGLNLKDTYVHILNADMGMNVTGENATLFKVMNSIYLPNIEEHSLSAISDRFAENATNSLDNVLVSISENKFSITQIEDMFYIMSEDNTTSVIIINSTSGIADVIVCDDDFAYKGSKVKTSCDCCSIAEIPTRIINHLVNTYNNIKRGISNIYNAIIKKIHPLTTTTLDGMNLAASVAGKLLSSSTIVGLSGMVFLMLGIHKVGNEIKTNFVDKKDWHWAYTHITFTRDGYLQQKKFFNIPKSDGTYDYIEVGINNDSTLNRNDAYYVSEGSFKKLTKEETYNYFKEEKWVNYNIPKKYQKYPVPF